METAKNLAVKLKIDSRAMYGSCTSRKGKVGIDLRAPKSELVHHKDVELVIQPGEAVTRLVIVLHHSEKTD